MITTFRSLCFLLLTLCCVFVWPNCAFQADAEQRSVRLDKEKKTVSEKSKVRLVVDTSVEDTDPYAIARKGMVHADGPARSNLSVSSPLRISVIAPEFKECFGLKSLKEGGESDSNSSVDYKVSADKADNAMLVQVYLKLGSFPKVNERWNLVGRFERRSFPYPGWAVAFYRGMMSSRFQLYWVDELGLGGWYSFDEVQLELGKWYRLSVIVKLAGFASVYLNKVISNSEANMSSKHGSIRPELSGKFGLQETVYLGNPIFLGGLDLAGVGLPNNDSFFFPSSGSTGKKFDGSLLGAKVSCLSVGNLNYAQIAEELGFDD